MHQVPTIGNMRDSRPRARAVRGWRSCPRSAPTPAISEFLARSYGAAVRVGAPSTDQLVRAVSAKGATADRSSQATPSSHDLFTENRT